MTNLVSLTCLSLQIQNSDGGISDFRISSESFMNESCHNSRTSNDIDMKRVSVSKHDNTNPETSKKLYDDVMSANCDVSLMSNLEQSGSWNPHTWFAILTFSLKIILYLTKTENRTKKSLTQLFYYCFG